jgi:hypothetical protein
VTGRWASGSANGPDGRRRLGRFGEVMKTNQTDGWAAEVGLGPIRAVPKDLQFLFSTFKLEF